MNACTITGCSRPAGPTGRCDELHNAEWPPRPATDVLVSRRPWTATRKHRAHLRATCKLCAADDGRPDHVALTSWHEWGHSWEGAPPVGPGHCRCGTELRNGPRFWHCSGCHETFAGEKPFARHRKGPGHARHCEDVLNAGPSPYWEDEHGVWHYGHRDERRTAPSASGARVPLAA